MNDAQRALDLAAHAQWLHGDGGQRLDWSGADLRYAGLSGADLFGADLRDATMPDGRAWEEYRVDHLAGLCDTPEVRAKAVEAWGNHSWTDCPMHNALGISDAQDAGDKALIVACWVALYDGGLLDYPEEA